MSLVQLEDTGVLVEVKRCPQQRSWSCPQDTMSAHQEGRGIPAFCSVEECPGRAGFVPYEDWLVGAGEIEPVFVGDTLLWVRSPSEVRA